MKNFLALCASSLLVALPCHGQSLADVLSSIQERKVAVEQRNQVLADYQANYSNDGARGWAGSTAPDAIAPINWQVTSAMYPSELQLGTLSLEDRVKALNIAIKQFDELKVAFVNTAESALAEGAVSPGLIQNYTELDLPSLGRADHRNYHQLLQTLALQVSKVKVIEWPFNCSVVTLSPVHPSGESGTNPTTVSLNTGSGTASTGPYFSLGKDLRNEKLVISGCDPEPFLDWEMTIRYEPLSSVALWLDAKNAPAPAGDVDLLGGEAVLFARDHYNPTTGVTRDGSNPIADGRYRRIDAAVINPSQSTESSISIPSETVNVSGTWENAEGWGKTFVPSGRTSGVLLDGDNSNLFPPYMESGYEPYFIEGIGDVAPGEYIVYQRSYRCLVVPAFEKGLDEGVNLLSSFKELPPAGVADPKVALSPSPSLLLAIDLGPGVHNHLGAGVLGIVHPKLREVGLHPYEWWVHPYSFDSEYPDCSFASELLFLGSQEDFHVSYETRREASHRAPLPEWSETPGTTQNWHAEVHGWESSGHLLEAWDRPRLRQVVGRQIVADISYGPSNSDYERVITLRRVPKGADLTPGEDGLVNSAGFPVIRALTVTNPNGAGGWPGPKEQYIEIVDTAAASGHKWIVEANDASATPGLDVWTVAAKTGTTVCAKVKREWDDIYGYLVTEHWDGVPGDTPASTRRTTFVGDGDYFDPLSKPLSVVAQPGTSGQVTTSFTYPTAASYSARWPETITVTDGGNPDSKAGWLPSGIPSYIQTGDNASNPDWKTTWQPVGGYSIVKETRLCKGAVYSTNWIEWPTADASQRVRIYSAPVGNIDLNPESPDSRLAIRTIDLHGPAATSPGVPWAVAKIEERDGSGAVFSYFVSENDPPDSGANEPDNNDLLTVRVDSGKLSGSSVEEGFRSVMVIDEGGFPVSSKRFPITNSSVAADPLDQDIWGEPNTSGAPTKRTPLIGATTSWQYQGASTRLASHTDSLGLVIGSLAYDPLERVTGYTWSGHSGSVGYTDSGRNMTNSLSMTGLGDRGWSATSDGLGAITSARIEAGRPLDYSFDRAGGLLTTTLEDTAAGVTLEQVAGQGDGSLRRLAGTSVPFAGFVGDELSVDGGLLLKVSRLMAPVNGAPDVATKTFRKTWTDAWGRPLKVEVSSTAGSDGESGSQDDLTQIFHSPPASITKRVEVRHASGRRWIEETEPWAAGGIIHRAGVDKNENGSLGAGDRFVTTTTALEQVVVPPLQAQTVIRTTVSQTGNSTDLMVRDFNPSNGVAITTINGGEDVFTETPNFTAKTSQIVHKRNGVTVSTKNITLNHLGQIALTTVSGDGMPATTINPTFRDDGSMEEFSVTIGGAETKATFAQNGTLAGFTHPLLDALPVSHDFNNGTETLTIDGTKLSQSLDGTASSISGAGVMAQGRTTDIVSGNFEHTINPGDPDQAEDAADGASTTLISNPAGAKVLHQYAAGANPSTAWLPGGLLDAVSLGRGGALDFGYSNDGAKDLVSITWPQVSSAGFPDETFYAGAIGITERDDAGNITRLIDPSGERDMDYEKNRLTTTDWLSGELDAYKVVREPDDQGRPDKVTLYRNGTVIHGIDRDFTGLSNEIGGVDTDGFAAVVTRDATSRHVTGFTRGGVTQSWGRGTAGRITSASSNVAYAPWFNYNSFDTKGRRQTVNTNKGSWTYGYRGGDNGDGQLVSATSTGNDLGNFAYDIDGIGRRAFGNNQQDELNRFLAMTHPLAPKKLFISAAPSAKLWVDGSLMTPFNGGWTHPLAHPGSAGGWVPWTVKGVLEDAGDEDAFDHAVAELSGSVFFPPEHENFDFDLDGNRESSALWHYGWDGRNQLVRARTKTWDSAPQGWDVSFDYDAEGRRFKKAATRYEDGDPVEQKVIYFVWDGWDLLYERHEDIQGNVLLDRRYVWGPDIADGAAGGAGGLLLIREKRGTTINDYYPLFDGTGHVTGLTDSAGNLVAEYWWGPFGELLEARGEMADANPFRYATKYYDTETGLYYFGHRYYDPVTGQFLSREPLGESESLNLYQYGHGDPINKVDVRGLKSKWVTDPNNPLTEMPDGSKVINLVWLVDKWFGDDYLDYSKRETRAFGTNYWDHHLWTKRSNGSWGASAGSQMWVDASRIAEERYHLSTYAKIGTVAMGGYSALLAAPVAGAYGTGSLFTAGGATVESSALQATNWLLLRPGAQILAADIAYTTGEIAMGIDGPGGLITPADSFRAVPKATQYADDLFSEMRHLELSWPGSMRQLSNSGVPLYMASNRAADPMAVVNALSDWNSRRHYINGQNLLLDKAGLKHILERHHPSFWDGTTRASQSFFPKNMSVYEIENAISEVLKQNPARIGEIGANGIGPMTGVVNGVRYQLGLNRGRIGQFYPILD